MGVAIGATKACLQVQQAMDDISQGNVNALKIENFGALQWVTSSMNTSGFEGLENQDPGGKNRSVKVWYWQNPRTEADTDCTPTICTAGTTNAQRQAEMTLDLCSNVSVTLDEEQFRDFCDSGESGSSTIVASNFAQQQVQAALNQLLDSIDTDVVTRLNTHNGNFYGGIAGPKTVTMIKTDGGPFYGAETTVASDLEDAVAGFGTPAAIGQGYLRTYSQIVPAIACCDQTGIDLSKGGAGTWNYYSERRVQTVVNNTNRFFVCAPGAIQLVTKNKWVGPYEVFRNEDAKTTVRVPVPGGGSIPVDFTVVRDFCGTNNDGLTNWILTWNVNYDFWTLPSDDEAVGSNFNSINGIFAYTADCGDITCADVNS